MTDSKKVKIVYRKVEDLVPYEKNPRLNEEAVPIVARSINDFGFKIPMVVDSNNVVVCGHTRLLAAKQLGLKEVPCIIADDLSEDAIKAFRLVDNQAASKSGWDFPLLDFEIAGLEECGWDMEQYGFMKYDEEDPFGIPEEAPEEPEPFGEGDRECSVVVTCFSESDCEEFMQRMLDEGRNCRKLK